MKPAMPIQSGLLSEFPVAFITSKRFLPTVNSQVIREMDLHTEFGVTFATGERPFVGMASSMGGEGTLLFETLPAFFAREWLLATVDSQMFDQTSFLLGRICVTHFARVVDHFGRFHS